MNQQHTLCVSLDVRSVLDVLAEPAFLVGLDGYVSTVNEPLASLERDAPVLHQSVDNLFDPEISAKIRATLQLAVSDETAATATTCGQVPMRLAGKARIMDTKVLRAADQSFVGVLCRQVLEDGIAKPMWLETVDSVGLGIWAYDAVLGVHYASDVWRKLHQVGEDEDPPIGVLGPQDAHSDRNAGQSAELKRQVTAGEIDRFDYRYPKQMPDGHLQWIRCRGEVKARDTDGVPLRVVGTENDVTAQYKAERELKQVTSKFELAIAAAKIGIFEFDSLNHEVIWDDRMLELYGIEDNRHRHSADLWETYLHPDERDDVVAYSDQCLAERRDFQRDYRIVQRSGDVLWIRSLARYFDYGDAGGSLVGVNMDVTKDYLRQEALERARAQLEHDAYHDALTGLANRRLLDQAQAKLTDRCSVMHIDLDEFKAINDTLGHAAGDAVLVHVARALDATLPSDCLRSRVGGDEFVVLFSTAIEPARLAHYAGALLSAISKPIRFEGTKVSAGASIGIAISEQAGPLQKHVFVHADAALYQAKAAGRMQYRFYNGARSGTVNLAEVSPQALRNAIDTAELVCHYQPQFDAHSRRLIGAETLVRWRRSETELLPPIAFLPQAEALGLMTEIDALVLDVAIRQLAEWTAHGLRLPRLSVNISAATITDDTLHHRLARQRLPAKGLAFELLETIRLDQQDDVVKRNLACIVDQGIGIEIDDFGTAYASILSLQQIRPERLKIDRALLNDVVESHTQREIVAAIVAIARSTGAAVIAEGVETTAQAEVLTELGCDILQGFALGRPMDAQAFQDFALSQEGLGRAPKK